jgi:L-lysine 6-transaminase
MSVIERLKNHVLVDGFHVVVDPKRSHGSWIVEEGTGKEYLDCYSQFASQPIGWNHPLLEEYKEYLGEVALHKIANSDMYSETYADFVEAFSEATPDFKHYFFIDGGALAVENALKAAFDWKAQRDNCGDKYMDVIHFKEAFHGRTGYTMSLTNAGEAWNEQSNIKTKWYPRYNWTRVTNPKLCFPAEEGRAANLEQIAADEIDAAANRNRHIAAIIVEPIQGEGGDNQFRPEFFQMLREKADQHGAMLIFDEVQTGVGLTGKMWAYEHYGVVPDMMCFGKKTQVCGFCATDRIDEVENNVFKVSSRINSTWGGNLVDMARSRVYLQAIKNLHLVERAAQTGDYFLEKLQKLESDEVSNVRGKGLMLAFDLPTTERRGEIVSKLSENMMVLTCGSTGVRFRPHLTFTISDVDKAIEFIKEALS